MLRSVFPARLIALLPGAAFVLFPALALAEGLTVATWGGTYQTSQENAYAPGFAEEIDWVEYRGGLEEVRTQIASGNDLPQ